MYNKVMSKFKYLIAIIVTLSLISVAISCYFGYKTYKTNLERENTQMQVLQTHENAISYIVCKYQIEGFDLTKCPKP